MVHSALISLVCVACLLSADCVSAKQPALGSLGPAAAATGDLPSAPAASAQELDETTGLAAVLPLAGLKLIGPGDAVDAIKGLGSCVLDPVTEIADDPTNLVTGPVESVGCVAGKATGAAGKAVGGAVSDAAGGIADQWTKAVLEGASWLLRGVAKAVDQTTAPNLDAEWFRGAYQAMGAIALLLASPLLFFSMASALARRDAGQAIRSAAVSLPMAFVLSACALTLTRLGIAVTDWACVAIAQTVDEPGGRFLASTSRVVSYDTLVGGPGGLPTFVALGAGLLAFVCAVLVWIEFIIRDAAVYLSAFFLPLAFIGAVWPRTARASRRIVGLLVAVVFSKFVIVAVLSLAGRAAFGGVPEEGIEPLLAAIAMLLLAVAAPAALLGLIPLLDEEGSHEGLRRGVSNAAGRLPVPGPREVLRGVAREQAFANAGPGSAAGQLGTTAPSSEGFARAAGTVPSPPSTLREGTNVAPPRAAQQAVGRVVEVAEGRGATMSPLRAPAPSESSTEDEPTTRASKPERIAPPTVEPVPPTARPDAWDGGPSS